MSTWTYIIPGPAMGKRNITLYGDAQAVILGRWKSQSYLQKICERFSVL
jgi:hypothetical protein